MMYVHRKYRGDHHRSLEARLHFHKITFSVEMTKSP